MIMFIRQRAVCMECDGEVDIRYPDIYGHQYKITYCPYCGDDNIETEDMEDDAEF